MSRAWCLVKPGGQAMVGVPTAPTDALTFNAARIYGPLTYAHLFANWQQVHTDADVATKFRDSCWHCYQPLHILEKPSEGPSSINRVNKP